MAANNAPIFSLLGSVQWGPTLLTVANTAKDGTGTVLTVFTADPVNGGYVQKIRARSAGTNIQTVLRVFINNGGTNATPANNILFDEITLNATTLSEVAALGLFELPLHFALNPGYVINCTIGTSVAAGWYISVVGGAY
jgi:hypothetical protein